jgi:hypothetical protein
MEPQQTSPDSAQSQQPQVVYVTRPINPSKPEVSEEAQAKHAESVKQYPNLNLSEGEYIISSVRRHPIGLVSIAGFVGLVLLFVLGSIPLYASYIHANANTSLPSLSIVVLAALLVSVLVLIGGYIATYVYMNNRFYLTNESVIQEIQISLFAKHEQTVSLGSIEDASYYQRGFLPYLFNYGLIRLSTMGDETTYRFNYVANPKKQIAILNDAVEAFKNGRPVGH